VKAIGEVELVEKTVVLLEGNTQAVQHVVDECLREQRGILELSLVGLEVVMVLDGLYDISEFH